MRRAFYLVYYRNVRGTSLSVVILKAEYNSAFRMVIKSRLLLLNVYAAIELRSLLALYTRLNWVIYRIYSYKTLILNSINAFSPYYLVAK